MRAQRDRIEDKLTSRRGFGEIVGGGGVATRRMGKDKGVDRYILCKLSPLPEFGMA